MYLRNDISHTLSTVLQSDKDNSIATAKLQAPATNQTQFSEFVNQKVLQLRKHTNVH